MSWAIVLLTLFRGGLWSFLLCLSNMVEKIYISTRQHSNKAIRSFIRFCFTRLCGRGKGHSTDSCVLRSPAGMCIFPPRQCEKERQCSITKRFFFFFFFFPIFISQLQRFLLQIHISKKKGIQNDNDEKKKTPCEYTLHFAKSYLPTNTYKTIS